METKKCQLFLDDISVQLWFNQPKKKSGNEWNRLMEQYWQQKRLVDTFGYSCGNKRDASCSSRWVEMDFNEKPKRKNSTRRSSKGWRSHQEHFLTSKVTLLVRHHEKKIGIFLIIQICI